MTKKLILLRGIPASGKTSWSKRYVSEDPTTRARVNRDDLRLSMFTQLRGLTFEQESLVTDVEHLAVKKLLDSKEITSVVIDAMNIRPRYVREWLKFADRNKVEVEIVELPISLDEALKRDSEREKSVGEDVIRTIWVKYTKNGKFLPVEYTPAPDESELEIYVPDTSKPKAIIVDIDGTVAKNDGRRGWYEYEKVIDDKPKEDVIEIVRAMYAQGYQVLFVSGRTDDCYNETYSWLENHVSIPFTDLLMRKAGDYRKDSTVKYEIFNEHIRNNYNVIACWDDRRQVTAMFRSIGLLVNQVDFGDF